MALLFLRISDCILQDGLVEFYDNGAAEKNHESPWPSMGKIFIGAVGVLALGAALIQKS